MTFFSRKPIENATGMDLLHAATREKWSSILRMLKGSKIDDLQSMNNTLLLAVSYQKHKIVTALLDAGAQADAMDGRILREAALKGDVQSMRILFARQPALVRFVPQIRHDVYARWADIPGGDGSPYQDTINLLDRMIEKRTALIARARRRHKGPGKRPPAPGSV